MHSICHLALFQLAVALNQNEQFSQKLLSFLKNCCQNKFKLIQVQFKILKNVFNKHNDDDKQMWFIDLSN